MVKRIHSYKNLSLENVSRSLIYLDLLMENDTITLGMWSERGPSDTIHCKITFDDQKTTEEWYNFLKTVQLLKGIDEPVNTIQIDMKEIETKIMAHYMKIKE